MADEIFWKARNCVATGYNRTEADCPACTERLLIQQNSAGQKDLHCDRCTVGDILNAWGLTYSALHPEYGEYRPLPWGWWRIPARYAGPVCPASEQ